MRILARKRMSLNGMRRGGRDDGGRVVGVDEGKGARLEGVTGRRSCGIVCSLRGLGNRMIIIRIGRVMAE